MSLEIVTTEVRKAAANAPNLGKTLKLQLDTGVVFIDLTGDEAQVHNEDQEADTTIITTESTLEGLRSGSVNPMMAMMSGKIKIKGDMGLAMKFQSFLK